MVSDMISVWPLDVDRVFCDNIWNKQPKKKGTNFLHEQDARNRFTMFESLFTRIHGLKLRSFVLKILKIVCDLKQNLLLDNTFKTCQHFN